MTKKSLDHPYLKEQIIAYIGNKRRLLGLIDKAVFAACPDAGKGVSFLDAFSGSGIVSRYARLMEFDLHSNDWEFYSHIINQAYLLRSEKELEESFGGRRTLDSLLERLNHLDPPGETEEYISRYYAPRSNDIDKADHTKERLFYTRENAQRIDSIRNEIERLYPENEDSRKSFLIALLLYQAATHTNTSGVFKACHKGFGGYGRDALKRILQPVELKMPPLVESPGKVTLYREDANSLVLSGKTGHLDIAYLDPPYNQHQYGSNYHMLNTIALWDKIPEPLEFTNKGELIRKAAIRQDWVNTRSGYCYRISAAGVFSELINNLNADHILISYSTDGIITFEEMRRICSARGRLSLISNEYTKFRGGKQSNRRLNSNIEFIFSIDTRNRTSPADRKKIDQLLTRRKIYLQMKSAFSYQKMKESDLISLKEDELIVIKLGKRELKLRIDARLTIRNLPSLENLPDSDLFLLYEILDGLICHTREEELLDLFFRIKNSENRKILIKKLPILLKKLAYKKTRDEYEKYRKQTDELKLLYKEDFAPIETKLKEMDDVAAKRFAP